MTTDWNFADVYEALAAVIPDRPYQIQGDRLITWAELDRRSEALAADVLAAGIGHQGKVAYLYDTPQYRHARGRDVASCGASRTSRACCATCPRRC